MNDIVVVIARGGQRSYFPFPAPCITLMIFATEVIPAKTAETNIISKLDPYNVRTSKERLIALHNHRNFIIYMYFK